MQGKDSVTKWHLLKSGKKELDDLMISRERNLKKLKREERKLWLLSGESKKECRNVLDFINQKQEEQVLQNELIKLKQLSQSSKKVQSLQKLDLKTNYGTTTATETPEIKSHRMKKNMGLSPFKSEQDIYSDYYNSRNESRRQSGDIRRPS